MRKLEETIQSVLTENKVCQEAKDFFRLTDKKDRDDLYSIAKNYDLMYFYRTVERGDDFPMQAVNNLIKDLEAIKKKAVKNALA